MSIFKKGTAAEKKEARPEKAKKQREARGSGYTKGRSMGTTLGTVALAFCVVSGPLALLNSCASASRPAVAPAPVATSAGMSVQQQTAGEYALAFTTSWLSATRSAPGDLDTYIDRSTFESGLAEKPWTYRDPAVSSIEAVDDIASVVVSVSLQETTHDKNGAAVDAWTRRYFQVPVLMTTQGVRVATLPTPIAQPANPSLPGLGYGQQLTTSDAAGTTVMQFLSAYLTGDGDVTRFVSPKSNITAVTPALFAQIDPAEMRADKAPGNDPADGTKLHVIATIRAANADSRALSSTYTLTLTARAGRWEISSVDQAPLFSTAGSTTAITPTPSPTR